MAIIPWKPLFDIDPFANDEDDWLLPLVPRSASLPPMNLYETDKDVVAEVNAPGIDPDKTEVTVDNGVLRVKGEGGTKKEEKKKNYWKKEITHHSFERMVSIPVPIDEKKVEANYKDGVLKVVMPKTARKAEKSKKIKVKKIK